MNKEKDVLALAVLQRALGTGPQVKWGSSISPVYKTVSGIAGKQSFAVSAFNAVYSDSGLFGFIICSEPDIAGSVSTILIVIIKYINIKQLKQIYIFQITSCIYKMLKSLQLSDDDICRGKNALKADISYATENDTGLLEVLRQQALFKGQVCTPQEIIASVDKITASDVKSVCKSHRLRFAKWILHNVSSKYNSSLILESLIFVYLGGWKIRLW